MFLHFVANMKSFGKEKHTVLDPILDFLEFRCENEIIWKGKTYSFGTKFDILFWIWDLVRQRLKQLQFVESHS